MMTWQQINDFLLNNPNIQVNSFADNNLSLDENGEKQIMWIIHGSDNSVDPITTVQEVEENINLQQGISDWITKYATA